MMMRVSENQEGEQSGWYLRSRHCLHVIVRVYVFQTVA